MTASTLLYCFSLSPYMLAVARALQGTSAVVIWIVGLALLVDTMGAAGSGAAMGWTSVASCAGSTIGPLAGGVVYDLAGHYAVFGVAFAVLGIDIFLRSVMIERKHAERWTKRIQEYSYGTVDERLSTRQVTIDQNPNGNLGTSPNTSVDENIVVPSPSTKVSSHASRMPVLVRLLLKVRILASLWGAFAQSCMVCALEAVLPLYTQRLFNWSPTLSGACMTAFIGPIVLDPLIGRLAASPTKRKAFATFGFAFASLAFFALTAVTEPATVARKSLLWAMLGLLGLGYSLAATPIMLDIGAVVEADERRCPGTYGPGKGVATSFALYNVALASGSLLGPALAGFVVQVLGWTGLCMSLGFLYSITTVIAMVSCGEWPRRQRDTQGIAEESNSS